MTTFADEELSKPCDHTIIMYKDDMMYFYYKCIYCPKRTKDTKLKAMNC